MWVYCLLLSFLQVTFTFTLLHPIWNKKRLTLEHQSDTNSTPSNAPSATGKEPGPGGGRHPYQRPALSSIFRSVDGSLAQSRWVNRQPAGLQGSDLIYRWLGADCSQDAGGRGRTHASVPMPFRNDVGGMKLPLRLWGVGLERTE